LWAELILARALAVTHRHGARGVLGVPELLPAVIGSGRRLRRCLFFPGAGSALFFRPPSKILHKPAGEHNPLGGCFQGVLSAGAFLPPPVVVGKRDPIGSDGVLSPVALMNQDHPCRTGQQTSRIVSPQPPHLPCGRSSRPATVIFSYSALSQVPGRAKTTASISAFPRCAKPCEHEATDRASALRPGGGGGGGVGCRNVGPPVWPLPPPPAFPGAPRGAPPLGRVWGVISEKFSPPPWPQPPKKNPEAHGAGPPPPPPPPVFGEKKLLPLPPPPVSPPPPPPPPSPPKRGLGWPPPPPGGGPFVFLFFLEPAPPFQIKGPPRARSPAPFFFCPPLFGPPGGFFAPRHPRSGPVPLTRFGNPSLGTLARKERGVF